jgi:hypothetical protein
LLIRQDVRARWDAFVAGFRRCGFSIAEAAVDPSGPDDVLVIWNRHRNSNIALRYERLGNRVLVAENGWLNAADGSKRIALQIGHHNTGAWHEGPEDRWSELGIELKPWRTDGAHLLVLGQRGIGEAGIAQPRGWLENAAAQLRSRTSRQVIVRPHPGNHEPPLEPDWTRCWAAVTWGSGAAIKAIVAGVPVFYGLNGWVGARAAMPIAADLEDPFLGDRLPMLRRLAHGQWSLSEIATGEPFARLLSL